VRRYLLTLPVAAVAFMGLAVVDERETFLAAWGFGGPAPASTAPTAASAEAEAAVRAFNAALESGYAEGSAAPLAGARVSPDVLRAVEAELSHPLTGAASRGLRLLGLSFVQVEPAGEGGWTLTTEETWGRPDSPGAGAPSRLRFRYRLGPSGEGLRIEEMTPVLPEPVDATDR
jgi:hypothetical protein